MDTDKAFRDGQALEEVIDRYCATCHKPVIAICAVQEERIKREEAIREAQAHDERFTKLMVSRSSLVPRHGSLTIKMSVSFSTQVNTRTR